MKNYLLFTLAFLLLFSCKKNTTDPDANTPIPKDTKIYLTVIKEITDKDDIRNCIQFSDNRDSLVSIPGHPEYFISKVNPGKKVIWMGPKESKKESKKDIKIIEVNFKDTTGSTDILEAVKMKEKNGVVEGKVKMKGANKILSNEFYSITFSVDGVEYSIDPVIQLHNY